MCFTQCLCTDESKDVNDPASCANALTARSGIARLFKLAELRASSQRHRICHDWDLHRDTALTAHDRDLLLGQDHVYFSTVWRGVNLPKLHNEMLWIVLCCY